MYVYVKVLKYNTTSKVHGISSFNLLSRETESSWRLFWMFQSYVFVQVAFFSKTIFTMWAAVRPLSSVYSHVFKQVVLTCHTSATYGACSLSECFSCVPDHLVTREKKSQNLQVFKCIFFLLMIDLHRSWKHESGSLKLVHTLEVSLYSLTQGLSKTEALYRRAETSSSPGDNGWYCVDWVSTFYVWYETVTFQLAWTSEYTIRQGDTITGLCLWMY